MKPAEYVGAVTSVWRRLLDERRGATPDEVRYLSDIFSRSGFTDGYFHGKVDHGMLGTRTEADKKRTDAVKYRQLPCKRDLPAIAVPGHGTFPDVHSVPLQKPEQSRTNLRTAVFYDPWQVTKSAQEYFDLCYVPIEAFCKAVKDGIAVKGAFLPPVIWDSEEDEIRKMLQNAKAKGLTDLLISNVGHLHFAREFGLVPHGNFRLNGCNAEAMRRYEALGFTDCILSPELTLPRLRDIGGQSLAVIYGRIPLMVTEKCVGSECGGCKTCEAEKAVLVDRMGKKLPVLKVWKHRSEIFNCVPVYMADKPEALREAGLRAQHCIFSTETPRQVDQLIRAFREKSPCPLGGQVRRIQVK